MKRVCVIGSSHLAALKSGWNGIGRNYPGIEITFFGAPGKYSEDLHVAGNRLTASNSVAAEKFNGFSGRSSVSGNYDYFLVSDLGIRAHKAAHLYGQCRAESHVIDHRQPVSDECFHLALLGLLKSAPAIRIIESLRTISTAPIAITPSPMRTPDHPDPHRKMARENGDDATLAETFLSVLQELARTMEVLLVPQPALTLAEPLCTDFRFSRAATKLTTGRDDSDFGHMNGLYGAIVIRKFIAAAKLAERPEPKRIGYRKAPSTFSGLARNVAARLAIHAARR